MASLKEIKSRIQSVKSTQKITSAMKMVSSAKLRKAQKRIESFYPYEQKLNQILNNFLNAEEGIAACIAYAGCSDQVQPAAHAAALHGGDDGHA